MLRWMTPFLVAIFAIGTAAADDTPAPKSADSPATKSADSIPAPKSADGTPAPKRAAPKNAAVRAASKLPPGLPRAHDEAAHPVAGGVAVLAVLLPVLAVLAVVAVVVSVLHFGFDPAHRTHATTSASPIALPLCSRTGDAARIASHTRSTSAIVSEW